MTDSKLRKFLDAANRVRARLYSSVAITPELVADIDILNSNLVAVIQLMRYDGARTKGEGSVLVGETLEQYRERTTPQPEQPAVVKASEAELSEAERVQQRLAARAMKTNREIARSIANTADGTIDRYFVACDLVELELDAAEQRGYQRAIDALWNTEAGAGFWASYLEKKK